MMIWNSDATETELRQLNVAYIDLVADGTTVFTRLSYL